MTRDKKHLAAVLTLALIITGSQTLTVKADQYLWEIGERDNDVCEFELAPDGWSAYDHDGLFIAGSDRTVGHWPYVHPGPLDTWSGNRQHTFTVLFGLESSPLTGDCRLIIDMIDTHSQRPPVLEITVNGKTFTHTMPKGASDASVSGEVSEGREFIIDIPFQSDILKQGTNRITIENTRGSWFIYDWVGCQAPEGTKMTTVSGIMFTGITEPQVLVRREGRLMQPVTATIFSAVPETEVTISADGIKPLTRTIVEGYNEVALHFPAVEAPKNVAIHLESPGNKSAESTIALRPVRRWEVYLLHHSHVDIGYTHVQDEVMRMQWSHLRNAVDYAKKSASYPEGARFKYNAEVLWAVDDFLDKAQPEERAQFIDAVRKGQIGLDALYGNQLTALSRPEELMRMFDRTRRIADITGVDIESAMITDVPGYTWGLIAAMGEYGVKYFSIGPNSGHRIGTIYDAWGDRPFYWVSPSGKSKVLCWIAGKGYSWFHTGLNYQSIDRKLREGPIFGYLNELDESGYPYDIVHVRYNIGSDNGPPDPDLADIVKAWNEKYVYPKLVIATTSEMFREFESRYGDQLPAVSGDFTPYWEDGAASSAEETALTRKAAERLVQAETLWTLRDPATYPADEFAEAWRNVLLYNEHTWGSWNSISAPEDEFTLNQWRIKQRFALEADRRSRDLLDRALSNGTPPETVSTVTVVNTNSWPRTGLVILPASWDTSGNRVTRDGEPVPSQRLSTGELAFMASEIPAFSTARFDITAGSPHASGNAHANGATITNGRIDIAVDTETGAINRLYWRETGQEFIDPDSDTGVNDYFYVAGRDPSSPQRNSHPRITVTDPGPLVAELRIDSDAPGCNRLSRRVRLVDGLDRVDIAAVVDKKLVYEQEGVHLAFSFDLPGCEVRTDIPWAVARVEKDQLPGACRNYFTVQRWADVSTQRGGVTIATVDAPMMEVGGITTDAVATGWMTDIEPSPTVYSYLMNNYWETNYKAGQEGPVTFRYVLRPHRVFAAADAYRFGVEASHPLVAVTGELTLPAPPVTVATPGVAVTSVRPTAGGSGVEMRLYNTSGMPEKLKLTTAPGVRSIRESNPCGTTGKALTIDRIMLPNEIVTVVVE